jgi:hypothetical protein
MLKIIHECDEEFFNDIINELVNDIEDVEFACDIRIVPIAKPGKDHKIPTG